MNDRGPAYLGVLGRSCAEHTTLPASWIYLTPDRSGAAA
jgi:hypothetical protein